MKKPKWHFLLATALVVFYVFLGQSQALAVTEISTDINESMVWSKEHSPYIVRDFIYVNAPLIIKPGVVVKFDVSRSSLTGLGVTSPFSAIGTPTEPIIFTSSCDYRYGGETKNYCTKEAPHKGDWYALNFDPKFRQPAELEYVKVFYAYDGISHWVADPYDSYKNYLSVRHSEIRYCQNAGLFLRFTQPILDGLILANNHDGITLYESRSDQVPKIRNSSIFDNVNGIARGGFGPPSMYIDARYNWWGDSSGPHYEIATNRREAPNLSGTGNRILCNGVLFRPWDQSDPTIPKEPVIFIPGIGASINPDLMISGILADNWTMFDHTYDGILAAFKAMGYVEGKNFFIAHYDWRKSNAESANTYLKPIIQKALSKNDADKVNIVTHSMGSLVARSYVQSDSYANDVNNLIMIAPPNRGSSDVYAAWEGGYIPKSWAARGLITYYLAYLQMKNVEISRYDIIHKFIPSLKELMPTYDYLRMSGAENLKNHQAMHEQNEFLQELNPGADKLNERTRFSVILGDDQPTVNRIPVVASDEEGIWQDGKPDPIDPEKNDEKGDGKVLISSGDIVSDFRDVLSYDHREIVSKSEGIVAERLNKTLSDIFDSPKIKDELAIWTDAPADLEVSDPEDNSVSRDSEEIADARYAEEKNRDGFKIISVPNPKEGNYKIKLSGKSTGKFHLGV